MMRDNIPHVYEAKIEYIMLPTHPDRGCVEGGWEATKVYDFSDRYTFRPDSIYYGHERELDYMQHDLMLVAGGGYNYDHIKVVGFDIVPIS